MFNVHLFARCVCLVCLPFWQGIGCVPGFLHVLMFIVLSMLLLIRPWCYILMLFCGFWRICLEMFFFDVIDDLTVCQSACCTVSFVLSIVRYFCVSSCFIRSYWENSNIEADLKWFVSYDNYNPLSIFTLIDLFYNTSTLVRRERHFSFIIFIHFVIQDHLKMYQLYFS